MCLKNVLVEGRWYSSEEVTKPEKSAAFEVNSWVMRYFHMVTMRVVSYLAVRGHKTAAARIRLEISISLAGNHAPISQSHSQS